MADKFMRRELASSGQQHHSKSTRIGKPDRGSVVNLKHNMFMSIVHTFFEYELSRHDWVSPVFNHHATGHSEMRKQHSFVVKSADQIFRTPFKRH